jgi:hypothetical protein
MKKYQVIGGQYESCWYGESDSLHGAKIIATKNMEYWDNWQGWNTPKIYNANDCYETESNGLVTMPDGCKIILKKYDAIPIAAKNKYSGKWEYNK